MSVGPMNHAISAEAMLLAAMESTDEGILVVTSDGAVLATNCRFRELWRIPRETAAAGNDDVLLTYVLDQLTDPEEFLGKVRQLYGSDAEARDTPHFKDGRVFTRYTRALSVGAEHGRIWCFKDISEQAHAEQALRASEQKLLAILDNLDAGIYLKDTEGRYLFANRMARGCHRHAGEHQYQRAALAAIELRRSAARAARGASASQTLSPLAGGAGNKRTDEALSRLGDLKGLRDDMVEILMALLGANPRR